MTEERTILKRAEIVRHWFEDNAARVLRARVSVRYAFIEANRAEFSVRSMCRLLMDYFASRTCGSAGFMHGLKNR